jgi:hypothetical protein
MRSSKSGRALSVATALSLYAVTLSPLAAYSTATFAADDFIIYGLGGASSADMSADASFYPIATTDSNFLSWQLTELEDWRAGSVFFKNRIDLTSDFTIEAEVYLGAEEVGALGGDGMAFVLQPTSATELSGGGGLGYGKMRPVIAVEYDTWKNGEFGDDDFASSNIDDAWGVLSRSASSIAVVENDPDTLSANHTQFGVEITAGVNQLDAGQLEDSQWRKVKYAFNATTKAFTTNLDLNRDGDFLDTNESISVTLDLATILGTTSTYWGFTGATGGVTNNHSVRFPTNATYTATSRVNTAPSITTLPSQLLILDNGTEAYNLTLSDDATNQAQWGSSVASSDTSVATATVSVTSGTNARVVVTPVAAGTSTITVTVRDADGATTTSTFEVVVKSAPGAPTSVSQTISGTTANVTWSAPVNTGGLDINGYKIEIQEDGGGWTTAVANTSSPATSRSITNLSLNSSYSFRVSAINDLGTSAASTASTAGTVTVTTPAAPTGLSISYPSFGNARVSWSVPTDNGGSAVTGYTVQYEVGGSWIDLTPSETSASISGVYPTQLWSFRVAATNIAGTGPFSTSVNTPPVPYSGPVITSLAEKQVFSRAGQLVTASGERLTLVSSVTIEGKQARILSKTENTIVLELPELTVGVKDMLIAWGASSLTHQGAFNVIDPGVTTSENVDQKLNAGSFKGFVAIYAKGYQGKRLSAKVGKDWVIIPSLKSDFERIVEFTGAGYEINVRIFIDRDPVRSLLIQTK